jgi:small subunit ribosomal protein S3
MGQKVNPFGMRLGITNSWRSVWFATKQNFARTLYVDHQIRSLIQEKFKQASIDFIGIARFPQYIQVTIHTGRPGIIIGRKGESTQLLNKQLAALTQTQVKVDVKDIPKPDLNAQIVAEAIAQQIEKKSSLRKTLQKYVANAMRAGAQGIKILTSGRLNGSEIARTEKLHAGSVPTQTLRADIRYSQATAATTYGSIGVKVWIFVAEAIKPQSVVTETVTPRRGEHDYTQKN